MKPYQSDKPIEKQAVEGEEEEYIPQKLQFTSEIQSAKRNIQSQQRTCRDHSEQLITYFCFDCQCPPVCSECVIHGINCKLGFVLRFRNS
jgi:hypothetical protein